MAVIEWLIWKKMVWEQISVYLYSVYSLPPSCMVFRVFLSLYSSLCISLHNSLYNSLGLSLVQLFVHLLQLLVHSSMPADSFPSCTPYLDISILVPNFPLSIPTLQLPYPLLSFPYPFRPAPPTLFRPRPPSLTSRALPSMVWDGMISSAAGGGSWRCLAVR